MSHLSPWMCHGRYMNLVYESRKPAKMLAMPAMKPAMNLESPPKWRKCESFWGNGLRGWRLERAMDRMDQPRTSIDERMLSGRRAVVIV